VSGIQNVRAYIYQIAHSVVLSYLRRQNIVSIQAVEHAELNAFGSNEASPEAQVSDRDELFHLARLIAALPEQARRVFVLRRIEGLSQRETAARLHLSESTVEKHMARAVRLFMDALADGGRTQGQASRWMTRQKRRGADE
jgi:RNA polymerase sigma factor (sigma-70 family)